ncbi:hypothetical protein FN846DRAFT_768009, partial [Sphaerosporella brunnea]
QGRWKEAEELQVQVMEARKRVLDPEHQSTLASMHNLAHTFKSLGRNAAAIAMMEKSAAGFSRQLGEDHSDTKDSLHFLAKWRDE